MSFGLFGALLGGVLTLLSPCSVMLLPAFFSYAFNSKLELLSKTGVFYLGLITTLVPLGILAGSLGAFVNSNRTLMVTIASVIVIILGLVMLLGVQLPMFSRSEDSQGTSTLSVYALGTVYGLAGVCAGPILGAVLTMAALGGNALYGGIMLLVFAVGMVVPLLILAVLWTRFPFVKKLVKPRMLSIGRWSNSWTNIIGGLLTIAIGAFLIVTSGTATLGGFLTVSDQFAIESWVQGFSRNVPDYWVLIAAVVLLGAVTLWIKKRRRKNLVERNDAS